MHRVPRPPGSFASAAAECRDILGRERCAWVVGKSASTIDAWADPDRSHSPTGEDMLRLDHEVRAATGRSRGPFLAVMELREGVHLAGRDPRPLLDRLARITNQLGGLASAVTEALDPEGPGGTAVTAGERSAISHRLSILGEQVRRMQHELVAEDHGGEAP